MVRHSSLLSVFFFLFILPLGVLGNFADLGTWGEFGWLKAIYGLNQGLSQEKITNLSTHFIFHVWHLS